MIFSDQKMQKKKKMSKRKLVLKTFSFGLYNPCELKRGKNFGYVWGNKKKNMLGTYWEHMGNIIGNIIIIIILQVTW
jgi:hypothetical protein